MGVNTVKGAPVARSATKQSRVVLFLMISETFIMLIVPMKNWFRIAVLAVSKSSTAFMRR